MSYLSHDKQKWCNAIKLSLPLLLLLGAAPISAAFAADQAPAAADSTAQPAAAAPAANSAEEPAETVIIVKAKPKSKSIPQTAASQTTITSTQIGQAPPNLTITNILTRSVPSASQNPDNSIRIRGTEDQYSLYLDGAPIPQSVAGRANDILDPKIVQSMRIMTGGFPAEFGGQLGAVLDVTTKSGEGKQSGVISQSFAERNTTDTYADVSGGDHKMGYFFSGAHRQTNVFLSPLSEDPLHDDGAEDHGFAKLDYNAGTNDHVILQLGLSGAGFQVPNDPDRDAVGQDDKQRQSDILANLIWRHTQGLSSTRVTLYSHDVHRKFEGSPADLIDSPDSGDDGGDDSGLIHALAQPRDDDDDALVSTFENVHSTVIGLRADHSWAAGSDHLLKAGFDVSQNTGHQTITITSPPDSGFDPITDDSSIKASDVSVYVQDDWTPGRFLVNYGVRFDQDSTETTTNQVSPRLNIKYRLTDQDTLHLYYDRLFQPVAPDSVKSLVGQSSIGDNSVLTVVKPERDDLYEFGIDHAAHGLTLGFAAYYKTGRDVRDDDELGATQVSVQVNNAKAYFRGLEFSASKQFDPSLSGYANYSLEWSRNAGPVTGGLVSPGDIPPGYFNDDHDQTQTAQMGLSYNHNGAFADLTGEYGSGQPYGQLTDDNDNAIAINYLRVPSHFILGFDLGKRNRSGFEASIFATNLLDHRYIVKQATVLSDIQWDSGRIFGFKLSQSF